MNRRLQWTVFLAALLLLTNWGMEVTWADHEEHKEKKRDKTTFTRDDDDDHDRKHSEGHTKAHFNPVNNDTYKEVCGACHFAYQPELLPSASWQKVLAGLPDHLGQEIEVDADSKKIILDYVKSNGAEYSSAKRAVKIMSSLDGQTPLRITEVPYIRDKHRGDDIPADAFQRKSVGSRSNCIACHTTAEKGIYEEDYVKIPE
jgi:Dihaem cytochrome c